MSYHYFQAHGGEREKTVEGDEEEKKGRSKNKLQNKIHVLIHLVI